MDAAFHGYSAAQALRSGASEPVRLALLAARSRTLALADAYADALAAANMRVPYDPLWNPPLWELGHIGWFQEHWTGRNRERSRGVRCGPDGPRAASLMAQADSWYDSGRVAHPSRWELPLPGAADTRAYLADTLTQTLGLLARLPQDASDDELYFFRLVALHEAMHGEAATYMAPALGVGLPAAAPAQIPATDRAAATVPVRSAPVLTVPAQVFRLGYDGPGFAFDNELGAHEVAIAAFEIDAAPVSWSHFLPFVAGGGYQQARWWGDEGWAWLQQARRQPPEGCAADPGAAAVHLNAFEAQAWCRWAGRRLPTEAQWECAAVTAPGFAWGRVWEWTDTPFQPYPGFAPHPYLDYSAPWFGTRRVLRGACHATSPLLAHPRYRNFFEPHRRDIFAGFRSCA